MLFYDSKLWHHSLARKGFKCCSHLTTSAILLFLRCSGWRQSSCALQPGLHGEEPARQQPAQPASQAGVSEGWGGETQSP